MQRLMVFLIAGWSGFFLMALELLSGRLLAPNFGMSIQVWGASMTVFMLALSMGYLAGGRLSVKDPSIKRLSTILLAAAVATTPAVLFGDVVMDWIFAHVLDSRYGCLLAATALFFLPTMVAGMVSPYAVRLLVSESRMSGRSAGSLFFVSTFGSAAGTMLTSFYLVVILEMSQILWVLVGVSAALAVSTLTLAQAPVGSAQVEQKG